MMVSTGIVPAPPFVGGAIESHAFTLANAVAERGACVHFVGDIRRGTRCHRNLRCHPVHSPIRKFPVPFPGWIISHLVGGSLSALVGYAVTLQENIDVAHFHEETSALLYLRLRPRARTVFTLHNPPSWFGQSSGGTEGHVRRYFSTLTGRRVIARSDHFIALSAFIASELTKWLNLEKDRVSVVQHPIDIDFFKPSKESERLARERFSLTEPYIIFVGRLDSRKGIANLLQAVASLPSGIDTVIVGDGVQREELAGLSRKLNIESTVRFLGAVPSIFLPGLLSGANCMVLPSALEMSPLTVIESLACGTPVVATNLPVLVGVVRNGYNGILIPHTVQALANAISLMNTDSELRKRMRENARKAAVENHAAKVVADSLLQIYRQVLYS